MYQSDGINVYEWRKDAKGWYTMEVNALALRSGVCPEVGWLAKTSTNQPLVCTKVGSKLIYKVKG
jgi:hypothetical protein